MNYQVFIEKLTACGASFAEWWVGELRDISSKFLPEKSTPEHWIVADYDGKDIVLRTLDAESTEQIIALPSEDENIFEDTTNILREKKIGDVRVAARISPDLICYREETFPIAAASHLAKVISLQIERMFPFKATDIVHTYEVLSEDVETKQCVVAVRALKLSILDDINRRLAQVGLRPEVFAEGAVSDGIFFPSHRVLVRQVGVRRQSVFRTLRLAFPLAAAILYIMAVFYRQNAELEALNIAIDGLKSDVAAAQELTKEKAVLASERAFLMKAQAKIPSAEIIDVLSRSLSDDTWVFELSIKGRSNGRIFGITGNATDLQQRLRKEPMLTAIALGSPAVKIPALDRERFDISFQVKDR